MSKQKLTITICLTIIVILSTATSGHADQVAIMTPLTGATVSKGEMVVFEADATTLTNDGRSLVWHSNLNGPIGRGAYFETKELSSGRHVISLTDRAQSTIEKTQKIIITVSQ